MRAAALLLLVLGALAASGCAEEKIPPGAAAALIRESHAVETRLAAGDACGADRHARQLLGLSDRAIEAKLVPLELAAELRLRAARLSATLTCPAPPRAAPAPAATPQPAEEDDGGDRGGGKGHGKKKGHDR